MLTFSFLTLRLGDWQSVWGNLTIKESINSTKCHKLNGCQNRLTSHLRMYPVTGNARHFSFSQIHFHTLVEMLSSWHTSGTHQDVCVGLGIRKIKSFSYKWACGEIRYHRLTVHSPPPTHGCSRHLLKDPSLSNAHWQPWAPTVQTAKVCRIDSRQKYSETYFKWACFFRCQGRWLMVA